MGNDDIRLPFSLNQKVGQYFFLGFGIDRRQRIIHDQNRRIERKRPRYGDSLLLSA